MKLLGRRKKEVPPRRRAASVRLEDESNKFRRSATLTGSLSDDVRAGAEERAQLQTARTEAQAKRKKQRRFVRRLITAGIFGLLLLALAMNLVRTSTVTYAGHPSHLPSTTPYSTSAKEFTGSSLGNRLVLTINTAKLGAYIMQQHKEVASVQVDRRVFHSTLDITVTLRKPVLIWQTTHDAQAFYVDANGTSFSVNAYGNDQQLVHVNDESGVPAELGVPVASSRQISFLGQFVGQLAQSSQNKLQVTKIVFPSSSTKEIDVYITGRNYFVKAYLERSARAQAEEAAKGITYLEQKGTVPGSYIDVRTAERVFYK
ncbi:MAG TPA: hypothetical protein VLF60_01690 [Candidatus Saccharimonadales bacterium]|nr:hypothetical protein [Candidatus Saccharimonadales bacterium]